MPKYQITVVDLIRFDGQVASVDLGLIRFDGQVACVDHAA